MADFLETNCQKKTKDKDKDKDKWLSSNTKLNNSKSIGQSLKIKLG